MEEIKLLEEKQRELEAKATHRLTNELLDYYRLRCGSYGNALEALSKAVDVNVNTVVSWSMKPIRAHRAQWGNLVREYKERIK